MSLLIIISETERSVLQKVCFYICSYFISVLISSVCLTTIVMNILRNRCYWPSVKVQKDSGWCNCNMYAVIFSLLIYILQYLFLNM